MKRLLFGLAAVLLICQSAHALPKPSRILEVTVSGNTYNAFSEVVTLTAAERYATVQLRPGSGLPAQLAWVAAPNSYTANAARLSIREGEVKELWNFKLFNDTFTWYGGVTITGSVVFEISTYSNTIP